MELILVFVGGLVLGYALADIYKGDQQNAEYQAMLSQTAAQREAATPIQIRAKR